MQIFKYSNKQIIKYVLLIWIFIICLFVYSVQVNAQQNISLITVFPAVQDIKVNQGQNTRAQIQFRNGSDSLLFGNVKVADFIVVDKNGTTQLLEDVKLKPKYSAASWIKLSDDSVAIPKNEIVTINLYITPPQELTACGYYALVYFQPDPSKLKTFGVKQTGSNISQKVGGIISFTVENRICKENLIISRLEGPKFLEHGPVPVSFDLLNLGDIHVIPTGVITLTNMFDRYVDQQTLKQLRIFPEKAKQYDLTTGHKWMIGRYKVLLSASYGNTNPQRVDKSIYVWVFPWRAALLVLLTIILLYFFGRSITDQFNKKTDVLEKEVEEEKAEIEKLREALKKRKD